MARKYLKAKAGHELANKIYELHGTMAEYNRKSEVSIHTIRRIVDGYKTTEEKAKQMCTELKLNLEDYFEEVIQYG